MAVGEERNSAAHGIRWSSTRANKNFITRKQNKLKNDKKLSDFEAFSKLAERKSDTKSTQADLFADYNRIEFSRRTIRTPVGKPPRIRRKSIHSDVLDTRLSRKQGENLEYSYVVIEETELEMSTRERLLREVRQQNWMENETKAQQESRLSSPTLSQRQLSAVTHGEKQLKSRSLISFAPRVQYCNRLVHMDKGEFSKQFCDVLGPGLCSCCTKSQMQQFVIDEHTRSFPDICVSPYVLCVPQESERDIKTPFSVYKDCDPLQRRRPSTVSPTHNINGLKTRPNSCSGAGKSRLCDVTYATDPISSESSSPPLEPQIRLETPISSLCSSRRSSITRYLMESKNEELRARGERLDEDVTPNTRRVRISPVLHSPRTDYQDGKGDKLDPNCFSKKSAATRSSSRLDVRRSRSSMCKTPSIERTGKLRELPYWKFLIPEPPMMEVGRMNVSIYTPKQIPGIKIFDETFFDI